MLLGVIREFGELDSGASSVTAAPETAGQLSVGSVQTEKTSIGMVLMTAGRTSRK